MHAKRAFGAWVVGSVFLFTGACSDEPGPGATSTAGSASGGSAAGTAPSISGSGGSNLAGNTNNGGSAGMTQAGAAGASGAAGSRRVVASRSDLCKPACETSQKFCALVDVGCSDVGPCLLEAECHEFAACANGAAPQACAGPSGNQLNCVDDPSDACAGQGTCPGFCYCNQRMPCATGLVFNLDPAVCTCVPAPTNPLDCLDVDCPTGFKCEMVMDRGVCVKPAP